MIHFLLANTKLALTFHNPWLPLKPSLFFIPNFTTFTPSTRSMIRQGVRIDVRGIFKGYPSYFE
jgi:hypothetical protein